MTLPTTAIESLRTFAEQHGEIQFAHLCTAALHRIDATWDVARADASRATGHAVGCDCTDCSLIREESVFAIDAWAVERVKDVRLQCPGMSPKHGDWQATMLRVIRATDCTRPDGAIARSTVEV